MAVIKGLSGPEIERLKKNVVKTFKDCGLNITIETNLHTVNYLDVTFDLQKATYLPYRKQIITSLHKQLFKPSTNSNKTTTKIDKQNDYLICHQMKKCLKKPNRLTVML